MKFKIILNVIDKGFFSNTVTEIITYDEADDEIAMWKYSRKIINDNEIPGMSLSIKDIIPISNS